MSVKLSVSERVLNKTNKQLLCEQLVQREDNYQYNLLQTELVREVGIQSEEKCQPHIRKYLLAGNCVHPWASEQQEHQVRLQVPDAEPNQKPICLPDAQS